MAATSSIPDRRERSVSPARRAAPPDLYAEPRPLQPSDRVRQPRREWPWLRMGLMSAGLIAALAYLAQGDGDEAAHPEGPVPHAALIAPPPTWQPIVRPTPVFMIEGLDGKAMPAILDARRHASGGREDTLTFGVFGEAGYGRIGVTRGLAEPETGRFYVDLVRRAAGAGLSVVRSGLSEAVATKFGAVEAASATLAETQEQACLAFRFTHGELSFGFQGWLCGSQAQPVGLDQLACFIDRLALAGGADDQPLKVLFAQAERRRLEACAPAAKVASARRM